MPASAVSPGASILPAASSWSRVKKMRLEVAQQVHPNPSRD
jgi:hypothetical protein